MANITSLNVNGRKLPVNVDSQTSLLTVLRDFLSFMGTKYGCGEAQCGACTVLVDGQMTRSCTMPVGKVASKQITTIEGLEKDGKLHPLQEAIHRSRCDAVRLLHVRDDHGGCRVAEKESQALAS